ncbi:MAG: flagellar hook-length control protein FliK [Solirubrobacteraceae bacterium]
MGSGAGEGGNPAPGTGAQTPGGPAGSMPAAAHAAPTAHGAGTLAPVTGLGSSAAGSATADAPAAGAAHAGDGTDVSGLGAAAAAQSTSTSTATATPAGFGAAATPSPVPLDQAADAVRTTIVLGLRDGNAQARITLAPASLGAIQIHLQRTPDGVIARVIADHPEAARLLAAHSDELRRSLEAGGTKLLSLDIESSDKQGTPAGDEPAGARSAEGDEETDQAGVSPASSATDNLNQGLNGPTLVNVLA